MHPTPCLLDVRQWLAFSLNSLNGPSDPQAWHNSGEHVRRSRLEVRSYITQALTAHLDCAVASTDGDLLWELAQPAHLQH